MSNTTIVFALVVLAFSAVAVLSLMFAVSSNLRSKQLQMAWQLSKPAKLALEVADLAAVVDANKRATRAEFGKLWQKFAGPPQTVEFDLDPVLETSAQAAAGCENWNLAKLEGPRSKAAQCQCELCVTARITRASEKQRILAERNRARANGGE